MEFLRKTQVSPSALETAEGLFLQLQKKACIYARGWAFKRRLQENDVVDVEAAAAHGLWQAALRYDPSRGCAFTTMAWPRIRGAVSDWARLSMRINGRKASLMRLRGIPIPTVVSLDGLLETDAGGLRRERVWQFKDQDQADRTVETERRAEMQQQARDLIDRAPLEDREILRARFLEGRRLKELANDHGCTEGWASQRVNEALERLRCVVGAQDGTFRPT